jgi:hypothetical protein
LGTFLSRLMCVLPATLPIYFLSLHNCPLFAMLAVFADHRNRAETRGKTGSRRDRKKGGLDGGGLGQRPSFSFFGKRTPISPTASLRLLENPTPNDPRHRAAPAAWKHFGPVGVGRSLKLVASDLLALTSLLFKGHDR